jgi:uncharacterized delta-60 repeat protein
VIVAGSSAGVGTGADFTMLKYAPDGELLWAARHDGPASGHDEAAGLAVDGAANIYVTGKSPGGGTGLDFATVKYAPNGQLLWAARYDSPFHLDDSPVGIAVTPAGEVYVAGFMQTERGYPFHYEFVTVKYSATGEQLWSARYRVPDIQAPDVRAMALDKAGNVFVCGSVGDDQGSHYLLLKYDPAGQLFWASRHSQPGRTCAWVQALAVDNAGAAYVTGCVDGMGNRRFLSVKFDPRGNQLWSALYDGGSFQDMPTDVKVDNAGGVYVAGSSQYWEGDGGFVVVKYEQVAVPGAPAITAQPQSQTVAAGSRIVFSVTATGAEPLFYQWRYNGHPLADAKQSTLTLGDLQFSQSGGYSVMVSNALGIVTSPEAFLNVLTAPSITAQPVSQLVYLGNEAIFSVGAAGTEPLNFQWQHEGTNLIGATLPWLTIQNALPSHAGGYSVVVRNLVGVVTSAVVRLDVFTQVQPVWVQRHMGPDDDAAPLLKVDSRGHCYLGGTTRTANRGGNYFAMKYAPDGRQLWSAAYTIATNWHNATTAMTVDAEGNVYLTGTTCPNNAGYDMLTVKFNATGRLAWAQTYGTPGGVSEVGWAIAVDTNGNVYVGGNSEPDLVVVKCDAGGQQLWTARYPREREDINTPVALALDRAGQVYVASSTHSEWYANMLVLKYDPAGRLVWARRVPGNAKAIALDDAGGVYVTGRAVRPFEDNGKDDNDDGQVWHSDPDTVTMKLAAHDGAILWTARYEGPFYSQDWPAALAVDSTGQVYVRGCSVPRGSDTDENQQTLVLKYDRHGRQLWLGFGLRANGNENPILELDHEGNAYICDSIYAPQTGSRIATTKFNAQGNRLWQVFYSGPAGSDTYVGGLGLDEAANVYVAGNVYTQAVGLDYVLLKYQQSIVPAVPAPILVMPPRDQAAAVGSTVTFSVVARGATPLRYQWRWNGTSLVGATNANLVLSNAQFDQAGTYSVEVANHFGIIASPEAALTVQELPIITTPPISLTVFAGQTARFSVVAAGEGLSYQWLFNGAPIPGATNATLTLSHVQPANAGHYAVVVANPLASVTSAIARLLVSTQVVQTWVARYTNHGTLGGGASVVKVDSAGNVYVAGSTDGAGTGRDFVTAKYDPQGISIWEARFNNPGEHDDWVGDLCLDAAGNVYVTGSGLTNSHYVTLKYSPNGSQLWIARYTGPYQDRPYGRAKAIAVDAGGNVIVSGDAGCAPDTGVDIATVKYDPHGNELWAARYHGHGFHGHDSASRIQLDAAGNVYVLGESYLNGDETEYVVLKYSGQGQQLWTARYRSPGSGYSWPVGIALDRTGNVYIAGTASFDHGLDPDYCTVKFDPNGHLLWAVRYDGPAHIYDFAGSMAVDRNGNIIVTGTSCGTTNRDEGDDWIEDFLTVKYDSQGNLLWVARQAAHGINGYVALALDAAGNAYISGISRGLDTGHDYFTIMYDLNGNRLWMARFDDPQLDVECNADVPWALAVDAATNVLVTGNSDSDFTTVQYSQKPVPGLPVIIVPPQSQAMALGSIVTLSVEAAGDGPLHYQWRHNGVNLPDATTATLVLSGVGPEQAGEYSVEVSNMLGSTATPEARVLLAELPVINLQPASQTVFAGKMVRFEVSASGTQPLHYQWLFNGSQIAEATNATLTLSHVQLANAGQYAVTVTNAAGKVTSAAATLTILPAPTGPGSVDISFDVTAGGQFIGLAGQGVSVNAIVPQSDGAVLIGGDFIGINGKARYGLARLNADGSLDTSIDFGLGIGGIVYAIARQADGKVVVGGQFATANGQPHRLLARFNADGSLDGGFNANCAGPHWARVMSLGLQSDGKILVGGRFTGINGTAITNLARLYPDGTLDASFNPGYDWGGDHAWIHSVAIQPDGKILVGGPFRTPHPGVVRLNADGSLDAGFVPQIEPDGPYVECVAIQSDGKIIVSGHFFEWGHQWVELTRLNADGSLDAEFDMGGVFLDSIIRTVAVQPDGKIVIGGWFSKIGGAQRPGVARLNATGSLDLTFEPEVDFPGAPRVNAVLLDSSGRILVGAERASGSTDCILRLAGSGRRDTNFNTRVEAGNGEIKAVVAQPDGKVLIAGLFNSVNSQPRQNLARLNRDGALDANFAPNSGTVFYAQAIALQPDDKVLVGGFGEWAKPEAWLFRLHPDGSRDATFDTREGPTGAPPAVHAIVLQSDGKILVGGEFERFGGLERRGIVRLNPDGSVDASFVPHPMSVGDDDGVYAIAVQPDGKIVIAGSFGLLHNDILFSGLARLNADGTLDLGFRPDRWIAGASGRTLLIQEDGRLMFGGSLCGTNNNQEFTACLVRLNSDGSLRSRIELFAGSDCYVRALAKYGWGAIYVGGIYFTNYTEVAFVVRLNPDGSVDPSFGPQFDEISGYASIESLAVQPDRQLLVAGNFATVNGIPATDIVRLNGVCVEPSLITQLASRTCFVGQSATFNVTATGTLPLHYQWLFNDTPIPGATNATLTLSHAQPANAGHYAVTVANAVGSVTSEAATLMVVPAPTGPGSVDITFDPTCDGELIGLGGQWLGDPWERPVNAVVLQPDGKFVIGGSFIGVNGRPRNNFARLNSDGSLDLSFDSSWGADGEVTWVAQQADGKILLTGWFTSVNGMQRDRIARLNPDGTVDADFAPTLQGGNPTPVIWHTVVQPDGKILVAGSFSQVNGVTRHRLARLQPDGSLDTTFDANASLAGDFPGVWRIHLQPDGRLLLQGDFDYLHQHLIRLHPDGSMDTDFNVWCQGRPGYGYSLYSAALQGDGKILMAGSTVSRINPDGSRDLGFTPANLGNGDAHQMEVQPDGKVLIIGSFSTVNGLARNCIARLNHDGSLDTGFNLARGLTNAHVKRIVLLPNRRTLIMAERDFPVDRTQCFYLLRADDTIEPLFCTAFTRGGALVARIVPLPEGKALISGEFSSINGLPCQNIARLNCDGTCDGSYTPALPSNGRFQLQALQLDGKVLVSGWFENPSGNHRGVIARLNPDGSPDTSFGGELIEVRGVNAMAVQADSRILLGGSFESVRSIARRYLARLNPDGSLDPSFTPPSLEVGDDHYITSLAVQSDGRILAGGQIFDVPWQTYHGMVRLNPDGSLDQKFCARIRAEGTVFNILIQPDDKILVDSSLTVDGVHWPGPVRLNADGSLDRSFRAALEGASTMALQPDGKVLVGYSNSLVRLNPDGSLDARFEAKTAGGWLHTVALQPDGQVLVGGCFASVNGIPRGSIARLNNDMAWPFVARQLPSAYQPGVTFTVRLNATPASNVGAYAVEDQPPPAWTVTNVSHAGVFDAHTRKVKFGPFYDSAPQTLSYGVTPPLGETGLKCFTGTGSADGANSTIIGPSCIEPPRQHPADNNPSDWQMIIAEVTAYGAAWRRGQTWLQPPNPIRIDYVTRAAALWKVGECYEFDQTILNAPLWWVHCVAHDSSLAVHGASLASLEALCDKMPPELEGADACSTRQAPSVYVPGEPVPVTLRVMPSSRTLAYAIEEQVPEDCVVNEISDGGEFNGARRTVRWGPFLDNSRRELTYQMISNIAADRTLLLAGVASFDGYSRQIAGAASLAAGCRVQTVAQDINGFRLKLRGALGRTYVVESSSNLADWAEVGRVIAVDGLGEFIDLEAPRHSMRFYRVRSVAP